MHKKRFGIGLVAISLLGASACSNGATSAEISPIVTQPINNAVAPPSVPVETVAAPKPTVTVTASAPTPIAVDPYIRYESESQTAARAAADDLLADQPYSRTALIKALENSAYSSADATYGADYVWYRQAVLDAQGYVANGTDTGNKVYNLLIGDGFTEAQALFAVHAVGFTYTAPSPTVKPTTLPAPAPTRTQTPSTLPAKPPTQTPSTLPAKPPVVQPSAPTATIDPSEIPPVDVPARPTPGNTDQPQIDRPNPGNTDQPQISRPTPTVPASTLPGNVVTPPTAEVPLQPVVPPTAQVPIVTPTAPIDPSEIPTVPAAPLSQ